jgi:hypothetical protein
LAAAFDDDSDDLLDVLIGAGRFFLYPASVAGDKFDALHAALKLVIANQGGRRSCE